MFPNRRIITSGGDVFRDEYSLAFDGTDDYLSIAETTLSVHDTAYSFAFWVKVNSIGDWHPIIGDDDNFHNLITIDMENDRILIEGNVDNDYIEWATAEDPLVLGAWNHFAICLDGSGSGKAYQNGAELSKISDDIGSDVTFRYIGRAQTKYAHIDLSELSIYDTELSQSQVKTIYNGREPYNHKEGSFSKNLVSWWRMGDGDLDGYPLITDSSTTTSLGTDLSPNATCDSNITGWSDYDSGTVSHETSITHSGAGALRCTFDGNNHWGGMTTSDISSVQANTLYLIEAYIYIPSGYDGGPCYLTDGGSFSSASTEEQLKADENITNTWQYTNLMFRTSTDDDGKLYIRTSGTDPSNTKYVIVDNITMRPVTGGNPAHTSNMTADDFIGDTP